jgi:hypothetical protein
MDQPVSLYENEDGTELWSSGATKRPDRARLRSLPSTRRGWRGRLMGGVAVLLAVLIVLPGHARAQQAPYPPPNPPSSYPPPPPPPPPPGGYYQQQPPSNYPPPPPSNYPQPPPSNYPQQPPSNYPQQPPPGGYYQQPPGTYYQPGPGTYYQSPDFAAREARVGRRMRVAGIVLTSVGIFGTALLLAGAGIAADPFGDPYAATALLGAGLALGIPGLAVGIPLWAVGQRKINRARRLGGVAIAPWLAPTRSLGGVTAGATGGIGGVTLRF